MDEKIGVEQTMRFSIPRVRAVLVVGATLLIAILVVYIGYGRYRSLMVYRQLLKRSGISITHDTNGFTYSQSILNRKIFTLHAAKATQLGAGKVALHDAELTLFDRAGNAADHIKGAEIDYDEATEVARVEGVVEMEVQPPQGLANGGRAAAPGDLASALNAAQTVPRTTLPIHVRTSGLVYQRKLGTATTGQRVEFDYAGMHCTSMGAEFRSAENTLRLLSQVQMEGVAHGKPLHVAAASADMDQDSHVVTLLRPVITSDGRTATAGNAALQLRKDGSIERIQASEHVVLLSKDQQITAARLDAMLNAQTLPEKARLWGGVELTGTDLKRPMHGSAAAVDALFNAQGTLTVVTATGDARLSLTDRRSSTRGLERSMEGAKIMATFVAGQRRSQARLSEVHASGAAHAGGESLVVAAKGAAPGGPGIKSTQVWGDDLRLLLGIGGEGKAQPQKLLAAGHTRLQQEAPLGAEQISEGDTLQATFVPETQGRTLDARDALAIETAQQSGHVTIRNRAASKVGSADPGALSMGNANRATYDGEAQTLTLSGEAHLESDGVSLVAPIVVMDQATQDATARGGVQATIESRRNKAESAATKPAAVTHVLAASARFGHASQVSAFYGTDAQPARVWQDASQVQAATVLFDEAKRTFSARPAASGALVHAIFSGAAATPKPGETAKPASIVRVASPKMDYNDLSHEATFAGGVTMQGIAGEVRGQRAVLLLLPAKTAATQTHDAGAPETGQADPLGGSVDRVIVSGAVQMDQPGRHGTGDQLLYTAATGSYVLTGTPTAPPHIVDTVQGDVTGATLVFSDIGRAAGSTIVVAGDAAAGKAQGGRVHTEIRVKAKQDERQ